MTRWLFSALVLATLAACSRAADGPVVGKKAEEKAQTVMRDLRAHLEPPPRGWEDFQLRVVDEIGTSRYATAAGWEDWGDGKPTPFVAVTRGHLAVFGKDPDALALLLGRELARLALGHVPRPDEPVPSGGACAARRRDAEADLFAARLLLRSGYRLSGAVSGLSRGVEKLPAAVRPAWAARLDRLAWLLAQEDDLWRLTPAFETGLTFLALGKYPVAAACFQHVTSEFPDCGEPRACLGVALLMHHCGGPPEGFFGTLRALARRKPAVVTLAAGKTVTSGDDIDEVLNKLGRPTRTTRVIPGTDLRRLRFESLGIDVFAAENGEVIAVVLLAPKGK
jgi:hypothetical protein